MAGHRLLKLSTPGSSGGLGNHCPGGDPGKGCVCEVSQARGRQEDPAPPALLLTFPLPSSLSHQLSLTPWWDRAMTLLFGGVPLGSGAEAWHGSVFLEGRWTCMLRAFENVACKGLSPLSPLNKNTPTVEPPPSPSNPPCPWINPFTAHDPSKMSRLLSR